jgi:hypothetical protein
MLVAIVVAHHAQLSAISFDDDHDLPFSRAFVLVATDFWRGGRLRAEHQARHHAARAGAVFGAVDK